MCASVDHSLDSESLLRRGWDVLRGVSCVFFGVGSYGNKELLGKETIPEAPESELSWIGSRPRIGPLLPDNMYGLVVVFGCECGGRERHASLVKSAPKRDGINMAGKPSRATYRSNLHPARFRLAILILDRRPTWCIGPTSKSPRGSKCLSRTSRMEPRQLLGTIY